MSDLEEPQQDPELTQQMILLMLMRLYDVQMDILSQLNDERAERMQNLHEGGKLLGDWPWLK